MLNSSLSRTKGKDVDDRNHFGYLTLDSENLKIDILMVNFRSSPENVAMS